MTNYNRSAPDPALEGLPPLVTAAMLEGLLHCSRRTIRRLVATGRLTAIRTSAKGGGRLLFRRDEIGRYLATLEGRGLV